MDMNKYNEWPANHKGDKNPSPKIIALGKRITDVAGHMIGGVTAEDPEYWGLAEIITEEMAEVGLKRKRRLPEIIGPNVLYRTSGVRLRLSL